MNEDVFNASLRKFLKQVGVTSQREVEKAVRDAVQAGHLKGNEKLPAKMVLTIGGLRSHVRSIEFLARQVVAAISVILISIRLPPISPIIMESGPL